MKARKMAVAIGVLVVAVLCALSLLGFRFWTRRGIHRSALIAEEKYPAAPKFQLSDISGKPLNLSDFQGKVILIDFWATWCTPCRWAVPDLVELQEKYQAQGLRVIGISMDDDVGPVREFYKRFEINYPVAMGGDSVGDLFGGIEGLPTTFLIGRDGRIRNKHVGARGIDFFEPKVRDLLAAASERLAPFHSNHRDPRPEELDQGHTTASEPSAPQVTYLPCCPITQKGSTTPMLCGSPTQAAK